MQESVKYPGLSALCDSLNLVPIEWKGVKVYAGTVPVKAIAPNTGQVEGLPANPRQWTKDDLDTLCNSIKETPELTVARGVLLYPYGEELVALGGNMRHAAAKKLKEKELPCFIYPVDTPVEKLQEIVIKDNGTFGGWDVDALANEWDNGRLQDWGVPDWVTGATKAGGEGERKPGSRAAGEGDVNSGFAYAVRVEFETAEEQIALLAELEERGFKASAV